jgi:hypothetical protein
VIVLGCPWRGLQRWRVRINSAPLLADSAAVMIASDTFHARRARRVMHTESPDLASCLVPARDYLPFEGVVLHPTLLAFEAYRERRARRPKRERQN